MVALETPPAQTGLKAPDFSLRGTDGKNYSLRDVRGEKGLVVMFICNHCPYVKAQIGRIVRDITELQKHGIGVIAIMSNDSEEYPEDSFDNMKKFATDNGFTFPYVIDDTQSVAHAYDAVCTPDFFGFNANMELQYRGRLDASWSHAMPNAERELYNAMVEISKRGIGPEEQNASLGCSIKWTQKSTKKAMA